jgi:N-acetylglucosamine-6-phosphate deacetylase
MMRLRSERIVTAAGTTAGEVVVRDGRIERVGPVGRLDGGGDVVDLGTRWVLPGYIDLHVHGGGGAQFNTSEPEEVLSAARFHARHGTTALLATTVAAPMAELQTALGAIGSCVAWRDAAVPRDGAIVLGAHLEGPFLSPKRPGAMDPADFATPDDRALQRLLSAAGPSLRMMTIAPELPGALELVELLIAAGVVVSLGHSDATYAEASAAVRAGARSATHLFNAMRPFHHREPGVLGAVLDLPEVNCELICDGVHAEPAALRIAFRVKGRDGVRLVTDAMRAAGMPDGEYLLGGSRVVVTQGRATVAGGDSIAGSTLTMDAALANAVRFLGVTPQEAAVLASANPARLLGLGRRKGSIAAGMDADLVVLDDELRVCGTLVEGAWVWGPA